MKKNLGRIVSLVLSVVLLFASGCRPSTGTTPTPTTNVDKRSQIGKYPIATADNPITLRVWSVMSEILPKNIKDFSEILAFQELEKKTGIKVIWEHAVAGQDTEAFNLMIASGDLPDVIRSNIGSPGKEASIYVNQNVIIDIAPYLDFAPNFKKIIDDDPELKRQLTDDNGGIYFFPSLNKDIRTRVYRGWMIRKDWLDKVGLPVPKNTDELYNVLKTWQEKDVNGNGKKDECFTGMDYNKDFSAYTLLWCFGADWKYMVKDGKITHGLLTPEFKEGIAYMAKLYNEGLLDPDFMTYDNSKWEAKFISEVAGASYGIASRLDKFTKAIQGSEFIPVARIDGPNRKQKTFDNTITNIFKTQQTVCITTANKYVEETMRWMDWIYSKEGEMVFSLGVEGVSYEKVGEGQYRFTDIITNDPKGRPQNEMMLLYAPGGSQWPVNVSLELLSAQKTPIEYNAFMTYSSDIPDTSGVLPPFSLTQDEISSISAKLTDIEAYVGEAMGGLLIGKIPLDRIDTEVIPRLKQLGIDDVIKVYQAAYDRYMKKK